MLEGLLTLAVAIGGARLAAETVEIPGWVQLLLPYLFSGGALGWLYFRVDKKAKELVNERTEAEVAEKYEQMAGRAAVRLETMQAQLDAADARARSAEERAETIKAQAEAEHLRLRARITELEEEVATTRAQVGLKERRRTPPKR